MSEGKRRYDLIQGDSGTYIACVECRAIITDPKEHDQWHESSTPGSGAPSA